MTQKNVEMVIGRLVSDADFRRRYRRDSSAALDELGIELNPVERRELAALEMGPFEEVASVLSARLQRASFAPDADREERPAS